MDVDEATYRSNAIRLLSNRIREETSKAKNGRIPIFQAAEACRDAITEAHKVLMPRDPHILDAWEERARLLEADPNSKALALKAWEDCLLLRENVDGVDDEKTARTRLRVARRRQSFSDWPDDRVRDLVLCIVNTHVFVFETDEDFRLASRVGNSLVAERNYEVAVEFLSRLLDHLEKSSRKDSFRTLETRRKLAQALWKSASREEGQSINQGKVRAASDLVRKNLHILEDTNAKNDLLCEANKELLDQCERVLNPSRPIDERGDHNNSELPRDISLTTLVPDHSDPGASRGRALSTSQVGIRPDTLLTPPKLDIPKVKSTSAILSPLVNSTSRSPANPSYPYSPIMYNGAVSANNSDQDIELEGDGPAHRDAVLGLRLFRTSLNPGKNISGIPKAPRQEDTVSTSSRSGLEMAVRTKGRDSLFLGQAKSHDAALEPDRSGQSSKVSGAWKRMTEVISRPFDGGRKPDTHGAPGPLQVEDAHFPVSKMESRASTASTYDDSITGGRNPYLDSKEEDVVRTSQGEEYRFVIKYMFMPRKLISHAGILPPKKRMTGSWAMKSYGRPINYCTSETLYQEMTRILFEYA